MVRHTQAAAAGALKSTTVKPICTTGNKLEAGIKLGQERVEEAEQRAEEAELAKQRLFLASLSELSPEFKKKIAALHYYVSQKERGLRTHLKSVILAAREASTLGAYAKGRIDEFLAVFGGAHHTTGPTYGCLASDGSAASVVRTLAEVGSECKVGLDLEKLKGADDLGLGAAGFTELTELTAGSGNTGEGSGTPECQLTKHAAGGGYLGGSASGNIPTSFKWADGLIQVVTNGVSRADGTSLEKDPGKKALPSLTSAYASLKKLRDLMVPKATPHGILDYDVLKTDVDFRTAVRLAQFTLNGSKKTADADENLDEEIAKTFRPSHEAFTSGIIDRINRLPVYLRQGDKQVRKTLGELATTEEFAEASLWAQMNALIKKEEKPTAPQSEAQPEDKKDQMTQDKIAVKNERSTAKLIKHSYFVAALIAL